MRMSTTAFLPTPHEQRPPVAPAKPSGSIFRVKTGTVQLFVVCHTPFVHVAASLPSYHCNERIGSDRERRCAQWVCDHFNALEDTSHVTEHDVGNMLHASRQASL